MFKFGFGKKRKEKETQKSTAQGPVRELSEEEKKKVDKKKVDLDSAVAALKAMGKTDEEIARLFPRPLSEEEQKEKEKQLEDLFRQQNYAKVISAGTALMERSAFTGKIYQNVGFLIGMSAVFAKNPRPWMYTEDSRSFISATFPDIRTNSALKVRSKSWKR